MGKNGTGVNRRTFIKKSAKTSAALVAASALTSPGCADKNFDVLIKGGKIHDGTMAEPYVADIGVKDGAIAAIGQLAGTAKATLSADGLIVTPGFIDVHTHCDLVFKRAGNKRYLAYVVTNFKGAYNYAYQGVTTVITGNCGYGYTDTDYWFKMLKSVGFGLNVLHLAPHGQIREELFGVDQPTELSKKQLEAMKARVAEEMEKGAVGLSTGLEYAPGLLSPTSELIELAKVAARHGGIYATHVRDETGTIHPDGEPGILRSIAEAIETGKRAEVPVEIAHFKIAMPFNNARPEQMLELIETARDQGLDINADQYPYAAGSAQVTYLLPDKYKTSMSVKDEYKTKEGKSELKAVIEDVFEKGLSPDKVLISGYPEREELEGKTLKEIAEAEGRKPSEVFVEMACLDMAPWAIYFSQEEDVVKALMPRDYIITASDGYTVPKNMMTPHPRIYGTFTRKLKKYTLDQKIITLGQAIRSMTSLPADKFKIKGRGKIEQGAFADINVIDLETVTDHATFLKPHQYSKGIVHQLVNGVVAIEDNKATGKRGGECIRKA